MAPSLRRLAAAALATVLATWGLTVATPLPAYAAGDQIDSFLIDYAVQPSGVVNVRETITYRFGSSSGRHGIERYLIVREPYDDANDAVYAVTNIKISSPDRSVGTQWNRTDSEAKEGREVQARLRIGDPDRTISTATATYVIAYDLTGAMRTFNGYDEFYWDATGLDWTATISDVKITATVPGGVQDTTCTYGAVQSTSTCAAKIVGGRAEFSQSDLPPKQGVTIGTKIKPGLVSDNKPHLEPDGSQLSSSERLVLMGLGIAGAVGLVGAPLVGVLWWRKNGRDQRYAGLAPGMAPLAGQPAHIVPNDPDLPIPVAFSPPKIPVAEAGLLVDGQVDTRETAATIIDLAVRGALRVKNSEDEGVLVTLRDPDVASAPHEMVLLTAIFGGAAPGTVIDLSAQGSMTSAHDRMRTSVRNQVTSRGWFRKVPSAAGAGNVGFGAIVLIGMAAFVLGWVVLLLLIPLLPILVTVAIIRIKLRRGQRTADGRAITDQVEGFRTYLATAEANQLQFEEGEDIFSKYLPWAIIFELADRWAEICGDLVAQGRIPDVAPVWYSGNFHISTFNTSFLSDTLASAASPAPSSGSSGSGFGGGSSFSSGGSFSGGGGGGGGGGSW